MNEFILEKHDEFGKAIDFFKKEISVLRTGRANPAILEGITVDAYGAKTPLNGVASISVPDGQSMLLSPWDKGVLKDIEKAVVDANLGVGVVNEGERIRLTVPMMTEETRTDMVKKLNEKVEIGRIAFRKTRDAVKTSIEQAEKDKDVSEDEKFSYIKELDDEVASQNDALKAIRDDKEKDIMTI